MKVNKKTSTLMITCSILMESINRSMEQSGSPETDPIYMGSWFMTECISNHCEKSMNSSKMVLGELAVHIENKMLPHPMHLSKIQVY